MKRLISKCLMSVVVAVGVISGATGQAQEWTEVEQKGVEEGHLVMYHNLRSTGTSELIEAFHGAYPNISVEEVRLGSGAFYQRFPTEYQSGNSPADVVIISWEAVLADWRRDGWMMEWSPPEAAAFLPEDRIEDRMWRIQTLRESIVYNTDLVSPEEAPKDWADLFDPKWRGRVGMSPPWRNIPMQQLTTFWQTELGILDAAEKMKANEVQFFNGSGNVIQAVVRGDVAVAEITDLQIAPALESGAPIAAVYPPSGIPSTSAYVFVPAKAVRPNAAKVFVNWLLSAPGQEALQKFGGLAVSRPGVPKPELIPADSELKIYNSPDRVDPAIQAQVLEHWKTVFGVP